MEEREGATNPCFQGAEKKECLYHRRHKANEPCDCPCPLYQRFKEQQVPPFEALFGPSELRIFW